MLILITGGAGFIGSHIGEESVRRGHNVIVVDNLSGGKKENLKSWWDPKKCTFLKQSVIGLLPQDLKGVDVIFHQACSKCRLSFDSPFQDLYTNAYETLILADMAAKLGIPFIHASTGSVYGEKYEIISATTETSPKHPKSYYGVSKYAAELYLDVLRELEGLKYVAFRYHHVYGPRQSSDPISGGVISIFIDRLISNERITIYGDGNQKRQFTYVKDVVKANFLAFEYKMWEMQYPVFNIANPQIWTINDLADILLSMLKPGDHMSKWVTYASAKIGDIHDFNVSSEKFLSRSKMKYTPLQKGLRDTIESIKIARGEVNNGSCEQKLSGVA